MSTTSLSISRHGRRPVASRSSLGRMLVAVAVAIALGACSAATTPGATPLGPTGSATPGGSPSSNASPTALTVGLGYIPSVQFAQFYLAQQAGYYRDAGLEVTFQNRIDPDLVTLVGQGAVDVGLADGTSVIPAVSQGIPIRYIATIYGRYPSIVYAKSTSGITGPADLEGRRLGIPGKFGSSWIMLQALLASVGLTPDDLEVVLYPDFGQGVALQQGAVDAATGFANNEPVQLELTGVTPTILRVDDVTPLPGPGLIAGTAAIEQTPAALRAFVAATLRAMEEIEADPQRGLDAAIAAVPELAQDRATQLAILEATIAMWRPQRTEGQALGAIDRAGWQASLEFMQSLDLVPNPVAPDQLTTDELLPH